MGKDGGQCAGGEKVELLPLAVARDFSTRVVELSFPMFIWFGLVWLDKHDLPVELFAPSSSLVVGRRSRTCDDFVFLQHRLVRITLMLAWRSPKHPSA